MAIFYNYIKGCGEKATLGTKNVSSGSTELLQNDSWKDIEDNWSFLQWSKKLYYCKNDKKVQDFRDARNNPILYFNNTSTFEENSTWSTGRIITSQARGQEMLYDLNFKNGPDKYGTAAPTTTTTLEQTSDGFYINTTNISIKKSGEASSMLNCKHTSSSQLVSIGSPYAFLCGTDSSNYSLYIPKYSDRFSTGLKINGKLEITYDQSKNTSNNALLTIKGAVDLGRSSTENVTLSVPYYTTGTNVLCKRSFVVSGTTNSNDNFIQAPYFNATSDKRAKTNIQNTNFSALNIVKNTMVYTFNYNDSPNKSIGIIAQDVLPFDLDGFSIVTNPDATGENGDFMTIKESKLIYVLWKAIQEQQEEINSLKSLLRGDK